MEESNAIQTCKSCGQSGPGQYCSNCGQVYQPKRITVPGLMHDVFHFFTHLDKGFGYTLKQLITAPGQMQREYIEGKRNRHQKPFSMFFICITLAALIRYWVYTVLLKYYNTGDASEISFINEYMVILQIILLPIHILITYLFFYKSKYNYAEIGVFILYTVSIFGLIVTFVSPLKFIWWGMDSAYVELPIIVIYNTLTFIHFFNTIPRWIVILKSLFTLLIGFVIVNYLEEWVIHILGGKN